MARPRPEKKREEMKPPRGTQPAEHLLPMQLQITDEEGRVGDSHPAVDHARREDGPRERQKPGDPSTKRDKTWGAHEHVSVKRMS
jgi:hypothetical protein